MGNYVELTECIEGCTKLIEQMKDNCIIPKEKFAGKTADVLRNLQDQQLLTMKQIKNQLSELRQKKG